MSGNCPSPDDTNLFRIVRGVRDLFEGRRNTTGTVTLTPNADTTVVTHINFSEDSIPSLMPTTANAWGYLWYVSARANGSFTITHENNALTDRIFLYSFDG